MASLRSRIPGPISRAQDRASTSVRARWEAMHFATTLDEPLGYPHEWATYAVPHGMDTSTAWLAERLARVSKVTIIPGQTFSLRRVTGPVHPRGRFPWQRRTQSPAVTRQADVLATLIFNMALLGGLHVTQRHAHEHDTEASNRFFELGRDAVISGDEQDLRIVNTAPTPLVFVLGYDDSRLYGELRGRDAIGADVELVTRSIEPLLDRDRIVRDPLFEARDERIEEPGAPGARVVIARVTRRAGGPPVVEELPPTVYAPIRAVVRRGPRPAPSGE